VSISLQIAQKAPYPKARVKGSSTVTERILLIDDHGVFREALALLIDRQPDLQVVAQAASIAEGLSKASESFDTAVVDLSMPDGDGVDLIAKLRQANPLAKLLGLSRRHELVRYPRALEAGATTIINKEASLKDILDELQFFSSGEVSFLRGEV
jgi:DNA-binding NarL/FixJ family response regulator